MLGKTAGIIGSGFSSLKGGAAGLASKVRNLKSSNENNEPSYDYQDLGDDHSKQTREPEDGQKRVWTPAGAVLVTTNGKEEKENGLKKA